MKNKKLKTFKDQAIKDIDKLKKIYLILDFKNKLSSSKPV